MNGHKAQPIIVSKPNLYLRRSAILFVWSHKNVCLPDRAGVGVVMAWISFSTTLLDICPVWGRIPV